MIVANTILKCALYCLRLHRIIFVNTLSWIYFLLLIILIKGVSGNHCTLQHGWRLNWVAWALARFIQSVYTCGWKKVSPDLCVYHRLLVLIAWWKTLSLCWGRWTYIWKLTMSVFRRLKRYPWIYHWIMNSAFILVSCICRVYLILSLNKSGVTASNHLRNWIFNTTRVLACIFCHKIIVLFPIFTVSYTSVLFIRFYPTFEKLRDLLGKIHGKCLKLGLWLD